MARPPKPTALKLVTGNPGKRALNKQEPDPDYLDKLDPPEWMPERAKAVWREVVPHLVKAKLATVLDVDAISMGCVAVANYRYAVNKTGDHLLKAKHVEDDEGKVVEVGEHINPWAMVQSMSFKQAMAVFQKFGMTPADRSRVVIQPQGNLFGDGDTTNDRAKGYFE